MPDSTAIGSQRAELADGDAEEFVLCGEGEVLKSRLAVEHALACVGPNVGHVDDEVEPAGHAVVGCHGDGLRRDGADVSVDALEASLPVAVPTVVRVEGSCTEGPPRQHDAVVDGLGVKRWAEQTQECETGGKESGMSGFPLFGFGAASGEDGPAPGEEERRAPWQRVLKPR
ncbi:hypothetical protein RBB78_05725 [Tunturiibacter empetritectus]|uniref:hypothetical protein n=1 Tax=Tunturiibacter empetritectus TaxID=3069691 RepID=UPI003D9B2B95